ncbi:hypothetical protein [Pseudomonas sp. SCB32]|uniref:hypothetical protein n=1 Tax=Pseudomonas sp. SCB32 TaxID=2653853 RepID=UPI0012648120|nr:hypothetical protein [Pseudomonas sp. SCB32]
MNADWDDAPHYLKSRKRGHELGIWLVAIALGAGITALALYMAGHKLSFSPEPPLAQTAPAERYTPVYDFDEPARAPEKTSEQLFWENVNTSNRQQIQPKQTDYNDSNYVARGADNVVPMGTDAVDVQPEQPRQVRVTVVGETRDMKEAACWPLREGSIAKRNCKSSVGLHYRDRD